MLYPYRPSSAKNQQRWNFGVLYPQAYSDAQCGTDAFSMQTEVLISGSSKTKLEVKLRFLHLQTRQALQGPVGSLPDGWQEAVERDISVPEIPFEAALLGPVTQRFECPAKTMIQSDPDTGRGTELRQAAVRGEIEIAAERTREDLFKIRINVRNTALLQSDDVGREEALLQSLVSTHIVLGVQDGEFVSLLEPPAELQDFVAQCQNSDAWPVLVGVPGQRDTMLASPIILYDYPQIAPESVGDLFDGTEIDEILSLRIMTLTDEEKQEIRQSDDRARQILERTESMPPEQFMKLHGAVRGMRPLKETTP